MPKVHTGAHTPCKGSSRGSGAAGASSCQEAATAAGSCALPGLHASKRLNAPTIRGERPLELAGKLKRKRVVSAFSDYNKDASPESARADSKGVA